MSLVLRILGVLVLLALLVVLVELGALLWTVKLIEIPVPTAR